jgi:hypothetical protein
MTAGPAFAESLILDRQFGGGCHPAWDLGVLCACLLPHPHHGRGDFRSGEVTQENEQQLVHRVRRFTNQRCGCSQEPFRYLNASHRIFDWPPEFVGRWALASRWLSEIKAGTGQLLAYC